MFKKYLAASGLAFLRYLLGGVGNGLNVVGMLTETAFQQSCENLNAARAKQVAIMAGEEEDEPKIKLDPEDMN